MSSNHRNSGDYNEQRELKRCLVCGAHKFEMFLNDNICSIICADKSGINWRKHFENLHGELTEILKGRSK